MTWGREARVALDEVLRLRPEVLRLIDRLGTEISDADVSRLQDQLQAAGKVAAERLAGLLGIEEKEGTEMATIMALGRWTSLDGMRRYLCWAPIRRASQATTEIARAMCEGGDAGQGRAPLDPTRMSGIPLVESDPVSERRQEVPAGHIQVLLGTTGVLHRPLCFEGPPEQWTTFCGIRWASKGVAGKGQEVREMLWLRGCAMRSRTASLGGKRETVRTDPPRGKPKRHW